jgi:hypothetical protein
MSTIHESQTAPGYFFRESQSPAHGGGPRFIVCRPPQDGETREDIAGFRSVSSLAVAEEVALDDATY